MIAQNGEYGWNALYQQQPIPRTGAYFSPEKIKVEPFRPKIVRQVRAWDLASTANAGDYTVGILLGKDIDNRIWILDMIRGQYDAGTRDRIIRQTAELDGTDTRIRMPQDPGQAGKSQKLHLVQLLQGFPVVFLPVSGSKQLRADPVGSQIAAENVTMLRAEWNRYLLDELRSFPLGKNDDIVDALADAYSEVSRTRTGWTAG
jgi:predicted phage terminase large subunit-like protein